MTKINGKLQPPQRDFTGEIPDKVNTKLFRAACERFLVANGCATDRYNAYPKGQRGLTSRR